MNTEELAQFTALEDAFNAAMISNDIARIAACVSSDWTLVTPEAGPVGLDRILSVIANGVLTHDTMTKDISRVKLYGDVAVVTGRGRNTGTFKGEPISADEWITDVYHKVGEQWLCTLTHLTPVQV